MISFKLQIILLIGAIISFFLVVNLIKVYKLELKYSMLWLIVMVIIILLSIFPKSFSFISNIMGIELPVNALYLLTISGVIVIMFSLTLEVSKSTIKIKELSQEIGLLKHDLEKLQKGIQKK
ncbi:DUF2304 domain-containing protein [Paenibacillus polymyxa]|uniref:DUF2304 domain-containing protein n=1 Tax=Paenibacillus polymyxa TaxID=1406 RepID=UPI0004D993AA|nr:DUF2304 domain-containing protein [Paenibacillus polymyxa]KAF6634919.1 DUF2304 domain-containing protein [Paenibacillus sp. EKM208P]KEO78521.1 hypothetical protein EL23_08935 [Paenibacillus polymyxa]MCH6188207.1 DUF2304 domain-containing protein [Paenibacillus polymyxa]MDY8092218.1 DUF2304 domain-containing protein [Paenibacillus polymyxa]WRL57672.1 DUF2304 domain-containing protein [Paenibacillus polymyxa]